MVLVPSKSDKVATHSTTLNTSNDKPTISFKELLQGVTDEKESSKGTSLILALNSKQTDEKSVDKKEIPTKDTLEVKKESPKDILATLLSINQNGEDSVSLDEVKELNPKLVSTLSNVEVKELIYSAKEYLKREITKSDAFSKLQTQELPKTLDGLVKFATDLKLNISKVELKVLQPEKNIPTLKTPTQTDTKESVKTDIANITDNILKKNSTTTPIFKVENRADVTTQQIIESKTKTPSSAKEKKDEKLKELLVGDILKESKDEKISIATSKTTSITKAETPLNSVKTFEQLLQGSSDNSSTKVDGLTQVENDNLKVKLNEAKQMIKYLSSDVKQAIDDYKSPFTKVKVQLNPKNLGEIDLTIIQRGKNLVVNLSSNTLAVATLSQNINELRVQLNNTGVGDTTFNFNSSSQDENAKNQQHKEQQKKAEQEYNSQELESEEIVESLDILIPQYV